MTAPTIGLGAVCPQPFLARASASSMRWRSTASMDGDVTFARTQMTRNPADYACHSCASDDFVSRHLRGDRNEPNAHVEHTVHLVTRDFPRSLQRVEYSGCFP